MRVSLEGRKVVIEVRLNIHPGICQVLEQARIGQPCSVSRAHHQTLQSAHGQYEEHKQLPALLAVDLRQPFSSPSRAWQAAASGVATMPKSGASLGPNIGSSRLTHHTLIIPGVVVLLDKSAQTAKSPSSSSISYPYLPWAVIKTCSAFTLVTGVVEWLCVHFEP